MQGLQKLYKMKHYSKLLSNTVYHPMTACHSVLPNAQLHLVYTVNIHYYNYHYYHSSILPLVLMP